MRRKKKDSISSWDDVVSKYLTNEEKSYLTLSLSEVINGDLFLELINRINAIPGVCVFGMNSDDMYRVLLRLSDSMSKALEFYLANAFLIKNLSAVTTIWNKPSGSGEVRPVWVFEFRHGSFVESVDELCSFLKGRVFDREDKLCLE